jgi:hypothetical protein
MSTNNGGHVVGNPRRPAKTIIGTTKVTLKTVTTPPKKSPKKKKWGVPSDLRLPVAAGLLFSFYPIIQPGFQG